MVVVSARVSAMGVEGTGAKCKEKEKGNKVISHRHALRGVRAGLHVWAGEDGGWRYNQCASALRATNHQIKHICLFYNYNRGMLRTDSYTAFTWLTTACPHPTGTACKNNTHTHTHTHTTIETDQSARAASFSVVGGTSFAVTTASTAATVLSGGTSKPNASMANCFVFLHA